VPRDEAIEELAQQLQMDITRCCAVAGERTAREHYAWLPDRPAGLTKILKGAFSDKPKLAAIQSGTRLRLTAVPASPGGMILTPAHVNTWRTKCTPGSKAAERPLVIALSGCSRIFRR
jgi:hypothetical protein